MTMTMTTTTAAAIVHTDIQTGKKVDNNNYSTAGKVFEPSVFERNEEKNKNQQHSIRISEYTVNVVKFS